MTLGIELNREDDGRWLAEVPALAGVMCYGETRADAIAGVQALALRVIVDRLEHGETGPMFLDLQQSDRRRTVPSGRSQSCGDR